MPRETFLPHRVRIGFSERLHQDLQALADQEGWSFSQAVRTCAEAGLSVVRRRRAQDRAAEEGAS